MHLLLVTQIVDKDDSNLGFFHTWIEEIAKRVDKLTLICLKKGNYDLPDNVTVLSLGKEDGKGRLVYLWRFYKYVFSTKSYDSVLVHMNVEYLMLAGWLWRLQRKKVLLWYTHKSVTLRLRVATFFATNVFSASKESFRLKTEKSIIVGHGIDTESFPELFSQHNEGESGLRLLSIGRIEPTKRLDLILKAISEYVLRNPEVDIHLSVVGDPITDDGEEYLQILKKLSEELNINDKVSFLGGLPYRAIPEVYAKHDILLHTSETGSVDKVVLEALLGGMYVVTTSKAYDDKYPGILAIEGKISELSAGIEKIHSRGIIPRNKEGRKAVIERHSLPVLINKIISYFR